MLILPLAFSFRVVFINDLHAHYEKLPGLVKIIKKLRTTDSLLLNGGDEFTGTSMFRYYGYSKSVEFVNQMDFDAMTIGNHEFDKGSQFLADYLQKLTVPIISANVRSTSVPEFNRIVRPYIIKGDIGIIGSTTPDTKFQADIPDVEFDDVIPSIRHYVDELHGKGIRKIFLLSHNGFIVDKQIAAATSGLSVIIGAHTHTLTTNNPEYQKDSRFEGLFPTSIIDQNGDSVYVVQAKCYGEYVGYFDAEFIDNKIAGFSGDVIRVDDQNVDKFWLAKVKRWEIPVIAKYNSVFAHSSKTFDDMSACYTQQCDLNQFIADAMVYYYFAKRFSKSPWHPMIGVVEGGSVRTAINSGEITRSTIYNALPFDDRVASVRILGSELIKAVKGSIAGHRGDTKVVGYLSTSSHARIIVKDGQFVDILVFFNNKWDKVSLYNYYIIVASSYLISGGGNIFPKVAEFTEGIEQVSEAIIQVFQTNRFINDDISRVREARFFFDGEICLVRKAQTICGIKYVEGFGQGGASPFFDEVKVTGIEEYLVMKTTTWSGSDCEPNSNYPHSCDVITAANVYGKLNSFKNSFVLKSYGFGVVSNKHKRPIFTLGSDTTVLGLLLQKTDLNLGSVLIHSAMAPKLNLDQTKTVLSRLVKALHQLLEVDCFYHGIKLSKVFTNKDDFTKVFLGDLGSCKPYDNGANPIKGVSVMYASSNSLSTFHENQKLHPVDQMEALFYMAIELLSTKEVWWSEYKKQVQFKAEKDHQRGFLPILFNKFRLFKKLLMNNPALIFNSDAAFEHLNTEGMSFNEREFYKEMIDEFHEFQHFPQQMRMSNSDTSFIMAFHGILVQYKEIKPRDSVYARVLHLLQ